MVVEAAPPAPFISPARVPASAPDNRARSAIATLRHQPNVRGDILWQVATILVGRLLLAALDRASWGVGQRSDVRAPLPRSAREQSERLAICLTLRRQAEREAPSPYWLMLQSRRALRWSPDTLEAAWQAQARWQTRYWDRSRQCQAERVSRSQPRALPYRHPSAPHLRHPAVRAALICSERSRLGLESDRFGIFAVRVPFFAYLRDSSR